MCNGSMGLARSCIIYYFIAHYNFIIYFQKDIMNVMLFNQLFVVLDDNF
jgi:hypothetical protein